MKGKKCMILDPSTREVRVKLHWVPYHVADDTLRKALEQYGKVLDITRETWKVSGFEGVQSTTRVARVVMKEGLTIESLPHQLRTFGGNVLVVVAGRAPLCLRCHRTGHIRNECRVPRCDQCHRYGHEGKDCAKTCAIVTSVLPADDASEMIMDAEEAENTSGNATPDNREVQEQPVKKMTTAPAPTSVPEHKLPETMETAESPKREASEAADVGSDVVDKK